MAPNKRQGRGSQKTRSATPKSNRRQSGQGNSWVTKPKVTDVFEADDDIDIARGKHLDEVENYEYEVGDIDEEDDEELDSDEAFDESDEEKYSHFKFSGRNKVNKKADTHKDSDDESEQEVQDLNEEEEEEEEEEDEDDDEEYMDISEMLSSEPAKENEKPKMKVSFEDHMGGSSDESVLDEDEISVSEESEEDEEAESKLQTLDSFITSLGKKKSRKVAKEKTEAYAESEFNLAVRSAEGSESRKKISISDMLGAVEDKSGFSSLKKKIQSLESGGNKGDYKDALAAPLPKRVQDKFTREVAYEDAKKKVSEWVPIVKKNREADHLTFPTSEHAPDNITNASLASKFEASNELEKQVQTVLEESGIKESNLKEYEELELNKLSVEEVQARRRELRLMRELMFREERKAKRVSKIKSKAFRKLKKKEKEKEMQLLRDADPELDGDERHKAEIARAQERMTLKHKNTGKWAKQMLKHGNDDESRQAIIDQLQKGEALRRKIHDMASDEDSDASFASGASDEDDNPNEVKKRAFDEIEKLEVNEDDQKPKKGIFAMKFMQQAMDRQREENKAMIESFKEDLEYMSEDESSGKKPKEKEISTMVGGNPGRLVFSGGAKSSEPPAENTPKKPKLSMNEGGQISKVSVSAAHNTRLSGPVSLNSTAPEATQPQGPVDDESNPWLQHDNKVSTQSKKVNKAVGKTENKSEKLVSKLKKKTKDQEDDSVDIDLNNVLTFSTADGDDSDASNDESESIAITHVKNPNAFTQRDLVQRAFANDNVVEEFEEEKAREVEEDAPKDEDVTLPGWGHWVGQGVKSKQPKFIKKANPADGIDAKKRKDSKLKHVIINEKKIKKNAKYTVTQVPFPYQTREQYEKSMRAPIGKEWNATSSFQKMILPRVTTKAGTIIDPLKSKK
ncbi:small-subunit processome [Basidiobolus meristosporus CBS 931.73]|uniref:Small-subunit processome n=1 Tax=Basidiobolus meristosporus CBS 931.73 TaxID=1314790 RepID=A0A1Y1YL80_9FUNG|nr:small-subunit processome [Basidiobolus meristosporus CBS 931.73]|eukprot:ORX98593.1 small-subunit processome [Basidiobolus meristosporus CBS 931.73]